MQKAIFCLFILVNSILIVQSQEFIPIDTNHWEINAQAYLIEEYHGKQSIYLQSGTMTLKDTKFLNGTIEFDILLKEEQAFPGIDFRINDSEAEEWYIRPHLSGKPDANQATPSTKGISPWQLYFGSKYSFPYVYSYDDWTHVRLVVQNDKAQVFLDGSQKPNLSWNLFHEPRSGNIALRGGNRSGMHIANIQVDENQMTLTDFEPGERAPLEELIPSWELSNKFEEADLVDTKNLESLIGDREWIGSVSVEEGTAANISRLIQRYDDNPGNTVFAKVEIESSQNQVKRFEFGYSDRVMVILNGEPIYRGTNRWRSRDYRYLGTIGLFDSVYLNLQQGVNTLLLAVSEDFGGWLVTGRIADSQGIRIQ